MIDSGQSSTRYGSMAEPCKQTAQTKSINGSRKLSTKSKNTVKTNKSTTRRPGLGLKARPLQASTNTIHAQQAKLAISLKSSTDSKSSIDEVKKQTSPTLKETKTTKKLESDENDDRGFFAEPYDPLSDLYAFDQELYKRVCNLELADDGLPSYKMSEPFDF